MGVHAPGQDLHPRFQQRLSQMERIISRVVGSTNVPAFLSGPLPHTIKFPNLPSALEHAEFMRKEIQQNIATGAVQLWHWPEGKPPTVINPIHGALGGRILLHRAGARRLEGTFNTVDLLYSNTANYHT